MSMGSGLFWCEIPSRPPASARQMGASACRFPGFDPREERVAGACCMASPVGRPGIPFSGSLGIPTTAASWQRDQGTRLIVRSIIPAVPRSRGWRSQLVSRFSNPSRCRAAGEHVAFRLGSPNSWIDWLVVMDRHVGQARPDSPSYEGR